jgi:two-component system, NtrC family, sensor kinase
MLPRVTSILGKIAAGYVLSFLFLLLVASVLFVSLHVAEDEVEAYFGASRLLDTALEMRRYEKNYLLYRHREDLEAARQYAVSAGALIGEAAAGRGAEGSWLSRGLVFVGQGEREAEPRGLGRERTRRLLQDYRALLRRAGEATPGEDAGEMLAVESGIRDLGRSITGIAEQLSSVEGRNTQEMLRAGRRTLILLVVLFLLGTAFIARLVLLTALRPLKELELQMQRIASGDYRVLPDGSGDDEISSMKRAFNRMIQEILEHRQQMIQSERLAALGTALAGIAHEMNNPLSNISTSAEILQEENERAAPEERRELIGQIISQTDRATDIIRAVLDFSRETRVERRSTNLLSAIRGSLILVSGEMPAHVSVSIDVAPDIEIPADKTKLEQAFINLLTNAIDAMREDGRESRIAISARPTGEGEVEIAFRDTGVGIPRQVIDRIFDPFFTTKDVGKGTGLGLYLTHQIVEQHGGSIRAESREGEGTTLVIRLPRREPGRAASSEGVPGEARG